MPALRVMVEAGQLPQAPTSSTSITPVSSFDAHEGHVAAVGLQYGSDGLDGLQHLVSHRHTGPMFSVGVDMLTTLPTPRTPPAFP